MVDVNGQVNSKDEVLELKAHVKTNLELTCSRCLDTFIYPIDIDIEERFTNNPDLEDEGIMFVDGDTINITEVIENCIIFAPQLFSSWYAIYIAIVKTPIGNMYFTYPITPPKNGLKNSPIVPEFV